MFEAIEEPRIEAEEFIDAGEKTVIAVQLSARGSASGIDVRANWFHVVTARDDKAVRIEWYASRADALEAAGLSEYKPLATTVPLDVRVGDVAQRPQVSIGPIPAQPSSASTFSSDIAYSRSPAASSGLDRVG